jgi:hypothetical protein
MQATVEAVGGWRLSLPREDIGGEARGAVKKHKVLFADTRYQIDK